MRLRCVFVKTRADRKPLQVLLCAPNRKGFLSPRKMLESGIRRAFDWLIFLPDQLRPTHFKAWSYSPYSRRVLTAALANVHG